MAKLKQKEWMTITEAARYLSGISESGPISETDILQFAMDREITLSIRNTKESARPIWSSSIIPCDELSEDEIFALEASVKEASRDKIAVMTTIIGETPYYGLNICKTTMHPGIWDINPFNSGEKFYTRLWNTFQKPNSTDPSLLIAEEPTLINTRGERIKFSHHIELVYEPLGMMLSLPTYLIPEDSYLVIRKEQMDRLFQDETKENHPQEVTTKERNTLYRMILGMAMEKYGYDPKTSRNKATGENRGSICADLQKAGLPVDSDTIRDHLKMAIQTIGPNQS